MRALGAAVNDLGRDPDVVADCLGPLGIPAAIGEPFASVLPGHDDHEAVVERAPSGTFVYRCDCKQDGANDATLADVYAALAYGEFGLLSPSARAIWHRLLLRKAGRLDPIPVVLPHLPTGPDDARNARVLFAIAMGLREHDHPNQPMMFSRRFVAALCKISEERAREAIATLVAAGVIRRLPHTCRGAYLYVPGDPPAGRAP